MMKLGIRLLLLFLAASLVRPTFVATAIGADCFIECMQRSGCWSGGSVSDPQRCNNMPELCHIQCRGKSNTWGAIAFSRKEKISGWSYQQPDKAAAERVALQSCIKEGGAKCSIETSFDGLCGAIAVDGDQVYWGTAPTKSAAQQRAMTECTRPGNKKCAVEASVCGNAADSGNTPTAPPPPRTTSWGAIAYSTRDMGAGYSQGKADRASAEKEAMDLCAQRGKTCVLRTAFNKQCGALATDGNFAGIGASTDPRDANQKAIDDCKKNGGARCVLHISFCSM
jgi:hypothetical protein